MICALGFLLDDRSDTRCGLCCCIPSASRIDVFAIKSRYRYGVPNDLSVSVVKVLCLVLFLTCLYSCVGFFFLSFCCLFAFFCSCVSANRLLGICVFTCGFVVVASFCIHFINPILQVTSNDLLKIRP